VSLYKREDSEVWWLDIRHAGRRVRRSTGTTDRAEAQAEHNRVQIELWTLVPAAAGERTWGDAVALWCAKDRSRQELLSLAKFGRRFPDRTLSAVTREAVKEALSFCVAASTHQRYRAMILSILNGARREGWLKDVPDLASREVKEVTPDWLTPAQWMKLYAELPPHLQAMATFAIESGLRQANVLGLTWKNVSIERRLAWINAEHAKGKKAIAVPLSDAATEVLKAQVGKHDTFVFVYTRLVKGEVVTGPITEIKTAFIGACVRAGLGTVTITVDTVGKKHRSYSGFTWHGFRHTWASWHAQNGTPRDVLQKLGAWADQKMVQRYAHHSAEHLAAYANNTRKT
jgi:integrase